MNYSLFLSLVLISLILFSCGCTDNTSESGYSVSDEGILSVDNSGYSAASTVIYEKDGIISEEVVISVEGSTPVYSVLTYPEDPCCAVVFAPGAGVSAVDHKARAESYAESGIAFLAVDIRGNGGKSKGYPLDISKDLGYYLNGEIPQYYRIVGDLTYGESYLSERFGVPVYAVGSSNGGRYAAIAAAIDSNFSGYFGVSTSGFSFPKGDYSAATLRFIRSINPDNYIGMISPSPVYIFHSPDDNIIEFEYGQDFYTLAGEPKEFIAFNGNHGLNGEVDDNIVNILSESEPESLSDAEPISGI
ncbi:alpha/beta hydrolase [Methanoplanus endosymbiosus]|uniref:Alpha/beta hydrolase n=1 Tax=Methanoplanus endosymbiosus TaxID=33865 RepID=A0A9E7PNL1_9EURY|nr:alpha/beta hydrolase [Methanoplanus endosymbiosus]UUX93573.1 alpha/beta hydrolase [Methanoplanus endosymbiosus]